MRLKIHYSANGTVICKETGSLLRQTNKTKDVTCKRCLRRLRKGVQIRMDLK